MAKEALEKIKDAEEKAAQIKADAAVKMRELVAQASADAEKQIEAAEHRNAGSIRTYRSRKTRAADMRCS